MTVEIQWHVGTVRIYRPGGDSSEGTFEHVCSIIADPEDWTHAIMFAAMEAPPIERLEDIGAALMKAGFKTVSWERRTRDRHHWVRFDVAALLQKRLVRSRP